MPVSRGPKNWLVFGQALEDIAVDANIPEPMVWNDIKGMWDDQVLQQADGKIRGPVYRMSSWPQPQATSFSLLPFLRVRTAQMAAAAAA